MSLRLRSGRGRFLLFLIERATPACDREWVVGDTVEELDRLKESSGEAAARRWLRAEAWRVLRQAPRHRVAVRRTGSVLPRVKGDGAMSSFLQDLKYSLRTLRRSPTFAAIAITTLGIGIGANTAMFAVVNGVLLKPLPFRHADRLMMVHLLGPDFQNPNALREVVWSFPKYQTFLSVQQVYEDSALFGNLSANLTGDGAPERVLGEIVTSRYYGVLGVSPILGRAFTPEETDQAGASRVVMLGHGLWTRRFAADPAVLGRTIPLNDVPYTVIGVLPAGFQGLTGLADVWVPLAVQSPSSLQGAQSHSYYLIARRKPDVSAEAATAAVRVAGAQIHAAYPDSFMRGAPWGASARSLDASRADVDVRRASFLLLGAVGFVLLIACVNLTNLVGARALARRREVAVRLAIGAGRGRIVRQFAADGLVLGGFGAVAGVFLSWMLLQAATWLLPEASVFFRTSIAPGVARMSGTAGLTRVAASMIAIDTATLLFTLGVTALTAVLISIVPSWQVSSFRPADALRAGGRSGTDRGLHVLGARSTLVTVQVSLALVLLSGAGLMIKSVMRLHATNIGIVPSRVMTASINLPPTNYEGQKSVAFFSQLADRLRTLPDVEAVSVGSCMPVSGGCNGTGMQEIPARPGARDNPTVGILWASPDYFSTVGIRLMRGRGFSGGDVAGRPKVVLVSETTARVFWPDESPLGKRVGLGQGGLQDGAEVVGVVSDVRYRAIEDAPMPDVYAPLAQSPRTAMRLFVRARGDAASLAPVITREVRALDASLPVTGFKTLDGQVGDAMWRTRVAAWLLSAFAGLAALLTAIGIFGVMAQTVTQRTGEIGIRVALGAQRADVLSLVLGRAAIITGIGLVVGTAAALGATRLISAFLYEVEPTDPLTFVFVAGVLGLVALLASYIPARRATRVDAVVALRAE